MNEAGKPVGEEKPAENQSPAVSWLMWMLDRNPFYELVQPARRGGAMLENEKRREIWDLEWKLARGEGTEEQRREWAARLIDLRGVR